MKTVIFLSFIVQLLFAFLVYSDLPIDLFGNTVDTIDLSIGNCENLILYSQTIEFPSILERIQNLPDDNRWWPLWLNGYSLPSFLASYRVGLFDVLTNNYLTTDDVSLKLNITSRSARILTNKMFVLNLLIKLNNTYRTSQTYVDMSSNIRFDNWIDSLWNYPVVLDKYVILLLENNEESDINSAVNLAEEIPYELLNNIIRKSLSCAVIAFADSINFFTILPTSYEVIVNYIKSYCSKFSESKLKKYFIDLLIEYDIISYNDDIYSINHVISPFLLKDSPFYKGGIIQLMMRTEPPSPMQAWKTLEKDLKRYDDKSKDETLMVQKTSEAEALAHSFALHMDAQGIGQDVVVAQKVFQSGDRVVDLAAGGGSYSILGAAINPNSHFLIAEKGAMVNVARRWINHYVASGKIQGNIDVIEIDMFESTSWIKLKEYFNPNKIFLSNIFHDWSLNTNLLLAKYAYNTLPITGQFIIHEMPIHEDLSVNSSENEKIADHFAEVLRIWTEGTQYKRSEIINVLIEAGFSNVTISESHGPYYIFTATK